MIKAESAKPKLKVESDNQTINLKLEGVQYTIKKHNRSNGGSISPAKSKKKSNQTLSPSKNMNGWSSMKARDNKRHIIPHEQSSLN
jgi:hypothetical protein